MTQELKVGAHGLQRHLGLTSAIMITVGSVIGSGIFMKPLDVSLSLPNTETVYVFWVVIGLACLCGALAYAELGAMFPEAGGQYAFLREAWGPLPAFLFGWCFFFVINTGTMSALAVAFVLTLERLTGAFSPGVHIGLAVAMIVVLAYTNHMGVKWGAAVQNVTTFAKVASLALIVLAGYLLGDPGAIPADGPSSSVGWITAALAIFWAYEGWHQLPFSAAEMKNPQRDVPRGLILGVFALITLYVVVNAVYFHLVPIEEMRTLQSDVEVPTLAMQRTFGDFGVGLLAVMICISVFGAANPNLLSGSRAFYAMAKDGLAPKQLTGVHAVRGTPTFAIWSQAAWAILLIVVLKTFRDITEFVVFVALIFYGLTVAAVYVMRKKAPDRARPYRCTLYPLTPAIFIAAVLFVDVQMLLVPEKLMNALYGLGILAAGVPVYFLLRRKVEA